MQSLSQSLSSFSLSYLSFSLPTSPSLPLCVYACAANGLESLWANWLHDEKEEVRGKLQETSVEEEHQGERASSQAEQVGRDSSQGFLASRRCVLHW
jgi:hypothetical protein